MFIANRLQLDCRQTVSTFSSIHLYGSYFKHEQCVPYFNARTPSLSQIDEGVAASHSQRLDTMIVWLLRINKLETVLTDLSSEVEKLIRNEVKDVIMAEIQEALKVRDGIRGRSSRRGVSCGISS